MPADVTRPRGVMKSHADLARRAATRLEPTLGPGLLAETARSLSEGGKEGPVGEGAGAFLVSCAKLAWRVYHSERTYRAAKGQPGSMRR